MPDVVAGARVRAAVVPDPARRAGAVLGAVLAACLMVAALFVVVPPAAAHDQLLSSDPKDGAKLDEMPPSIVLTFSGEPMETGAGVVLTSEDGQEVALNDLTADGATLTATVPSTLPGGVYEASWHIVSGDGHPLEGAFSFTVGKPGDGDDARAPEMPAPDEILPSDDPDATAGAEDGSASGDASAAGEEGASGNEDASAEEMPGDPSGALSAPMATTLAVVGGVAVLLVLLVGMRRKLKQNEEMQRRGYGGGDGGGGGTSPEGRDRLTAADDAGSGSSTDGSSGSSGGDTGGGGGGD